MREDRINLVRDKSTGRTEQSYRLSSEKGAFGGGGCAGETRSEIVDSLSKLVKASSTPEVTITSAKIGAYSYPSYEALSADELEAIVTDLRSKVGDLKIVVES